MMTGVELWELFQAVTRDPAAWPALMAALEPELLGIARQTPIGRLREREDSPREIVAAVFKRFHANDHAVINRLCAQQPRPELRAWLRVVVRRASLAYVRAHPAIERASERLHVRRLVARSAQYLAVIEAVFAGQSHTVVAAKLGLSRRELELTLGYVEELLRARFATE